jgi:UDP-glucose 4-epimerase
MRVLVTGGCGFIGSHVVDNLIRARHEVLVVDIAAHPRNAQASYRSVDILDQAALEAAVSGSDAVFHLAGASDVDLIAADPLTAIRVNVDGTAAGNGELAEDAPIELPRAGHVYVSTKLAAELLAHSYWQMYGQHFTILRYGIPYGPRMRDALVVARFARAALAGRPITIAGTGEQQRNYVYVEDLADAHVRALSPAAENQTLALEGDTPVSVREVADTVRRLAGPVPVEHVPARQADYTGRSVSNALAKEVLEWSPSTSFTEGVRRYLEWCQASNPVDEPGRP